MAPLLPDSFQVDWVNVLSALAPAPAVVIANLAVRQEWARVANLVVAGGAVMLVGASAAYGLAFALAGAGGQPWPPLILLASVALAAPILSRGVRERLARVLPLDPESPVDLLALVAVILLVGIQADFQAGHDAIATVAESTPLEPLDVLGQELPLLLMALLGVGLFTRRPLPATLERLGVVRPAAWQVLAALAAAGLFVALSQGAEAAQQWLDPSLSARLGRATSHYYAHITGGFGIAVIALAPGISEELFFRGALQPRLGLLLAAIAFAAVHTQYALTVDTLLVFVLGFALGLIRRQFNTSSSIVCHAAYNALAGIGVAAVFLPYAIAAELVLALAAGLLWLRAHTAAPTSTTP